MLNATDFSLCGLVVDGGLASIESPLKTIIK